MFNGLPLIWMDQGVLKIILWLQVSLWTEYPTPVLG